MTTVPSDLQFSLQQRKELLKSVFGKTRISPFLWGVPVNEDGLAYSRIQNLHLKFWGGDAGFENNVPDPFVDDPFGPLVDLAELVYRGESIHCGENVEDRSGTNLVDGPSQIPDSSKLEPSLENQWVNIELPLWSAVRGLHLPTDSHGLVNRLERIIGNCLDLDGCPLGKLTDRFCLLIASWCRCQRLLDSVGCQMEPDAAEQMHWLNQQIARMLRADNTTLLGQLESGFHCNAFRKLITESWSDCDYLPFRLTKSNSRKMSLSSASSLSEWGQLAVFRNGWRHNDNKLGVRFDGHRIHLDIDNGKTVLCGDCTPEILVDGETLSCQSEIGVSCDHEFDGGNYVELEVDYGELTISRQLLFLANDEIVIINDLVCSPRTVQLEYRCLFPILAGTELLKEVENNEFYLRQGKDHSLVLPLFMPEWKSAKSSASVGFGDSHFWLENRTTGSGMAMPVLIDLNRKRSLKPRTWRQLTVAEHMEIVDNDVAVAFRIQIGYEQWLMYKTIGPRGNRTFLGQNFADDFFVGKMDLEGNIESILEIE